MVQTLAVKSIVNPYTEERNNLRKTKVKLTLQIPKPTEKQQEDKSFTI